MGAATTRTRTRVICDCLWGWANLVRAVVVAHRLTATQLLYVADWTVAILDKLNDMKGIITAVTVSHHHRRTSRADRLFSGGRLAARTRHACTALSCAVASCGGNAVNTSYRHTAYEVGRWAKWFRAVVINVGGWGLNRGVSRRLLMQLTLPLTVPLTWL